MILNVRLADGDLTAKARIRDAALHLFGREGYAATSVRAVATLAGVSPALVVHHFDSKDGLRLACDEYVVSQFLGRKDELASGDSAMAIQRWLADVDTYRPLIDYTSRMLTSSSPAADELFDALQAGTAAMIDEQVAAGIMRDPADRSVTALYLTLYGVVPLVMHHQITRALGVEQLSAEGIRRSTVPILDLYTHGLYTDDRFLVAAQEALARTSGPRSDKGENDPNQDPDPPHGAGS
ncbi:TetR family transcriptional regulator [Agromyces sp. Marseille-Q5079]|uniref:TetR family transcriptional regulator n=1 Tax=Agromyces sp. Marseille-Q5079 TaxID=3439059 RepID=UPI003D9CB251